MPPYVGANTQMVQQTCDLLDEGVARVVNRMVAEPMTALVHGHDPPLRHRICEGLEGTRLHLHRVQGARVTAAMPGFVQAVMQWQQACGVGTAATTLVGFSQGAIMALESSQIDNPPAARVIALSGRFARPPRIAHGSVRTHLLHGDADAVMPVQGAVDALSRLQDLGAAATLDRFPGLGHGVDGRVVDAIDRKLNDAVPAPV
jgi:predicted esterase